MAHNFRYGVTTSIAIYVSKDGNDANDGFTPNTAKRTVGAALALASNYVTSANYYTVVIGTGTYEEALNVRLYSTADKTCKVVADGEVVLRGNGTNAINITTQGNYCEIQGIRFENYTSIALNMFATNCKFRNITTLTALTLRTTMQGCQFSDISTFGVASVNQCIFVNVTNINVTSASIASFYNSYTNASSQLNWSASVNAFDFNNLMGLIKVGSGIAQYLADHKISYPNLNQNSINQPPKFNSAAKLDFSLQDGSPHIGTGQAGLNIGGTNFGFAFTAPVADCWKPANGAIFSGVELTGTDVVLSTGVNIGYVLSAPIKLFANPTIINRITYNGFTVFNKSFPGGTTTNTNVPDSMVTPSDDAGGGSNPDRLSYQMRWTDNDTMPGSDEDWINGYLADAGSFPHFELNAQPLIDNLKKGNGEPSFSLSVNYPIAVIWVQFKVTLTNLYV
jgi:hypothetical protein